MNESNDEIIGIDKIVLTPEEIEKGRKEFNREFLEKEKREFYLIEEMVMSALTAIDKGLPDKDYLPDLIDRIGGSLEYVEELDQERCVGTSLKASNNVNKKQIGDLLSELIKAKGAIDHLLGIDWFDNISESEIDKALKYISERFNKANEIRQNFTPSKKENE